MGLVVVVFASAAALTGHKDLIFGLMRFVGPEATLH
jgi:hypothetical protein